MIAAAEAMMSTMPPAAGELKNADGTSDILFLFLSGISDTLLPLFKKTGLPLIYNRWLSEDKPAELR
jgi:hypothetical protein